MQTLYPENAVLKALVDNDRTRFLELEKQSRQILNLPPYGKLAALIVSGANEKATEKIAYELKKYAPNGEGVFGFGSGAGADIYVEGKISLSLAFKNFTKYKYSVDIKKMAWNVKYSC